MKRREECVACGKRGLSRNEIGICKKMLGRSIARFYCLDCLAAFLECEPQDLLERIEAFKADGCVLFS